MDIAILRIKECEKNQSKKLDLSGLELEILPDLPNFVKILSCYRNKLKGRGMIKYRHFLD